MVCCDVTVVNAGQVEKFATRLYNKCLGRQPDPSGLDHWKEVLLKKERTGAQVAYGFVFSQEYKMKNTSDDEYVEMLYNVFFGSAFGFRWKDALDGGFTVWCFKRICISRVCTVAGVYKYLCVLWNRTRIGNADTSAR